MLMRTGSIAAIIVFWKFFISETFSNCASCNGANAQGRSAGSSGFYHACACVIIIPAATVSYTKEMAHLLSSMMKAFTWLTLHF